MRRLERIPIELIDPDPSQPRGQIDEAELAKLAENLQAVGQLVPCIVEEISDGEEEK